MPIGIVKFEEFELDGRRYELRRGDSVLKLEKIPMDLLMFLVENDGRLVTRDEIIERIWGKEVFLDTEHGINTAIRKIRQTLGDDPDNPRFVQTVTGKGYRFIAAITVGSNGDRGVAVQEPTGQRKESAVASVPDVATASTAESFRSVHRAAALRWILALLAAVGILAVGIGLNVRGLRDRIFSTGMKPQIHSLAVLPLENLSADPNQEYFADGMTDEIITMLAKNPDLRVVSRTSVMQYKKVHRPLPEIARELGVDGILEGSVERSGNRVHINAQLVYAPQDRHLWADSYDRDLNDLGSLQTELARDIAQQVGSTAAPPASPQRVLNPEAHDAYLLGRYYWFGHQYDKSREYFQNAIQLQPDYAAAHAALADSYTAPVVQGAPKADMEEAMAKAERAAREAIALDDSVAEAHHSMAAVQLFFHWNWNAADRESARAVELSPRYSEVHHLRAYVLLALQKSEEALQEDRKSMELDPRIRPWALGYMLLRTRQFAAGIAELRARDEVQPGDFITHDILSELYWHNGMAAESIHELAGDYVPKSAAELEAAFLRGGAHDAAEWRLAHVKKLQDGRYVSPWEFAVLSAHAGHKEETLHWLEQCYAEHVPWLAFLQNEPDFDFLHSEPRYQAIVKNLKLPPA